MSRDPFSGILDPFAWWDMGATYDRYAGFFDLVIYCSVFIAIANAVFTSRFTGRPGKVMATAIGIALGVSLGVVERQFGWSLRSAGPFAALIGLLLMGFLLLQTMVRVQIPWTLAVPLTYVLIYLLLRAVSPQLVAAMADKVPFLHLLTAVMFLICVWCPLGYEYDKTAQHLRPQAEEAKLIGEVYALAVQLRNATEVAKALNLAGKRTRQRVLIRKDGTQRVVGIKRFRCDRVDSIISNPIYKGVIRHGDEEYPSQHPALVSKDLWEDANTALHPAEGRTRSPLYKRDKHVHILKGLLKCGHCGTTLTPYPAGKKDANGNPYLYYACTHVVKDGAASTCPVRSIPARSFEEIIIGYIGELGRHPEIIAETIEVSNRAKVSALRPLKAKLVRVDKEFQDVAKDVQSCVEAAKKKGAGHISEAFIAEAEALAARKHELDIERQKLRIDLQYREQVVTDEKVIADSLLRFESVMKAMSPDEQKELVQLIVKQITVNHFDPERDEIPTKEGVFKTNIRTSWHLVNVELYASDLQARVSKEGKISSDFSQIGSAGGSEKRTSFVSQVTVAIPFSRWGAQPYITHPFLFPIADTDAVRAPTNELIVAEKDVRHPIRLALEWQQMLADNPGLNMAGIAQIKGVSRARVTQVMNLLRLPEQVQTVLLGVTTPKQIRLLSERKLRPIMACSDGRVKQQLVQQLLAGVSR